MCEKQPVSKGAILYDSINILKMTNRDGKEINDCQGLPGDQWEWGGSCYYK